MRQHGKSRVFYAVIYSGILFSGGCTRLIVERMYEHQPTCPEEKEIQRRQDKARPDGVRDTTQWIPPKASGEVGPAV